MNTNGNTMRCQTNGTALFECLQEMNVNPLISWLTNLQDNVEFRRVDDNETN